MGKVNFNVTEVNWWYFTDTILYGYDTLQIRYFTDTILYGYGYFQVLQLWNHFPLQQMISIDLSSNWTSLSASPPLRINALAKNKSVFLKYNLLALVPTFFHLVLTFNYCVPVKKQYSFLLLVQGNRFLMCLFF